MFDELGLKSVVVSLCALVAEGPIVIASAVFSFDQIWVLLICFK